MKPKSEISKILNEDGKLVWTKGEYLQTWKNYYENLLTTYVVSQKETATCFQNKESRNLDM